MFNFPIKTKNIKLLIYTGLLFVLTLSVSGTSFAENVTPASSNGMSFVHDLRAAPGVLADYTLYIPKLTDSNTVGFCPGATSISQLTTACPGYVVKQKQIQMSQL